MRILTCPAILMICGILQAQESTLQFSAGSGWNYNVIQDEAVSPMLYRGQGYAFQAWLKNTHAEQSGRLSFNFQHARIQPELVNESWASLDRAQIDWVRVFRVAAGNSLVEMHAGGHIPTSFHVSDHNQWDNNNISHMMAFSLGPSFVACIFPLREHRNIHAGWECSFPLVDYISRPGYLSDLPEGKTGTGNSGILAMMLAGRLTSVHEYQRLLSRVRLDWRASAGISLRIEYQWDFQHYRADNAIYSANHLVTAAAVVDLK